MQYGNEKIIIFKRKFTSSWQGFRTYLFYNILEIRKSIFECKNTFYDTNFNINGYYVWKVGEEINISVNQHYKIPYIILYITVNNNLHIKQYFKNIKEYS
jgi:hypothetical protein